MPQNLTNASKEHTESSTSANLIRTEWVDIWVQMADTIAKRSRCDRAQVGAVIVDEDWNVLSVGYNGPAPAWSVPESVNVYSTCKNWCPRAQGIGGTTGDYSNCPANHAEINALARMTPTTKKTFVYINRLCCFTCAKALAAAGVSMVMCKVTDLDGHIDTSLIEDYFSQCGIIFWRYSDPSE